jgi:hypothetical protein
LYPTVIGDSGLIRVSGCARLAVPRWWVARGSLSVSLLKSRWTEPTVTEASADCAGDALERSVRYVAGSEYARQARLEGQRHRWQGPRLFWESSTGQDESSLVDAGGGADGSSSARDTPLLQLSKQRPLPRTRSRTIIFTPAAGLPGPEIE